jgi:hypothetical protein
MYDSTIFNKREVVFPGVLGSYPTRGQKGIKKSDALSTSASQKAKKLLAEDLNLEPSG